MKKCPVCEKGNLVEIDDIVSETEIYFFIVKGRRCSACNEEFINEKEGQRMITSARELCVWC